MVSKVLSATPYGFYGQLIEVEGDMSQGLPSLQIVGMGNKAIEESRDRVRSAIKNSHLDFPKGKIVINLAPAELPKDGVQFDLPIALAILCLGKQLSQQDVGQALFAGELALDGSLRPIKSAITLAEVAKSRGISTVYVPTANAEQALLIAGVSVIPVPDLTRLFLHLKGEVLLPPATKSPTPSSRPLHTETVTLDMIRGQEQAKRAITVAVAGRHNILLSGPPGSGKTMLAQAVNSLLPPLSDTEIIEVTKLHHLGNHLAEKDNIITQRPFRAPHHTASRTAIIGGGTKIQPGEVSLAHRGTLFLDELLEYPRATLEALRQPLEDHAITISRAQGKYHYPADFLLVATMNPCPCGYLGDPEKACRCTTSQILQYQKRLSGPLLDRIDLTITVSRVPHDQLLAPTSSSKIRQKLAINSVVNATNIQYTRYKRSDVYNGSLNSRDIDRYIPLTSEVKDFLTTAAKRLDVSARSYFKTIKVARTIADLDNSPTVEIAHIAESLQYRQLTSP